jgi:SAM-dependent methyltransferase
MTIRNQRILATIPEQGSGIEYGPLHRTLVPKSGSRSIRYVDFAPRDVLVKKYESDPNVDVELIPDIDIVTGGRRVDEFIDPDSLDFVVASHIAEHVPDLVGWLQANLNILRIGGRIAIAFPDRRYCFDLAKQPSQTSDLIAAYLEERTRPSFQQQCDHFFNIRQVTPSQVWNGEVTPKTAPLIHQPHKAVDILRALQKRSDYVDVHCWKFSDTEFFDTINTVRALFDLPFQIVSLFPTQCGTTEFYATLEKT